MINQNTDPQVIVIGGGPAGSTASTLVAQRGYRVALYERDHFPRFHIGESLIPETYHVLKRLNMLDKMKKSHFVKKFSVQFVNEQGKLSAPFFFMKHKPHECSQTWQVVRSEFDQMMLQNAAEHGVQVQEGVRVLDVLFEGERAVGVQLVEEDGTQREVRADVIIDASGQSSMLINKLKLRVADPQLNKGAIWTYFQGAYRDDGENAGATIVCALKGKKGWFWYIPLHNDIVSVGVVGDFDYLFKNRGSHEQTYLEELDRCPNVKERVSQGQQVSKYFATKDYTYRASRVAGDGWVLVGDAFGFLDPLYSSGVLLALKSGELAADAVCEGLAKGDTSSAQLSKWGPEFITGMNRMRRLVLEYYDGLSFGKFIRRFPNHQGDVTDLLIGDLFKDSLDQVFRDIDTFYAEQAAAATAMAGEE